MRGRQTRTRARLRAAFAAAVLLACACAHAAAQDGKADDETRFSFFHGLGYGEPWYVHPEEPREEVAALNARWKALGEELQSTPDTFAGTYDAGSGMRQSYLRWAPGGGFVYLYIYEHYSVLDFSYGRVEVTPTAIVFTVERERRGVESAVGPSPTPRRWVAARWRGTNFLVPEKEIPDFGLYVGGLGRYNEFNGPCCEFTPFMASAPGRDPRKGSEAPAVPAPYARLMRRPVEATLRFVGRKRVVKDYRMEGELYSQWFGRASLTPVTLDAGRGRGLKPGLLLRLVGEPVGQYLKLTRVLASRSEGVVIRDVDDDGGEYYYEHSGGGGPRRKVYPPVRVGARVTTAPPDTD